MMISDDTTGSAFAAVNNRRRTWGRTDVSIQRSGEIFKLWKSRIPFK